MSRFEQDAAPAIGVAEAVQVYRPLSTEVLQADSRKESLAIRIANIIARHTTSGIRDLKVEVSADGVLLQGRCATYYSKQLAQHAAMSIAEGQPLINEIRVS